jgi:hypothetical protein
MYVYFDNFQSPVAGLRCEKEEKPPAILLLKNDKNAKFTILMHIFNG